MGMDSVGQFDIDGTIVDNVVIFEKQYRGAHMVDYKGTFDGRAITGLYWNSGPFKIWVSNKIYNKRTFCLERRY